MDNNLKKSDLDMKVEEIMLGDWVKMYNGKGEYIDDTRVDINTLYTICQEWQNVLRLEPIPLTPEILEKNGFSRNGLHIALFDRRGGDDFLGASNLQYVHELQHAMRLCGIEKEIVL